MASRDLRHWLRRLAFRRWFDLKARRDQFSRLIFRRRYTREELLFFIHLPKTAGTSFRNMLFRVIGQEHIFPNWQDLANNGGLYPTLAEYQDRLQHPDLQLRLLSGHIPFILGEWWPGPKKYLVFLRDPVERTISHLQHLQRDHPTLRGKPLEQIFRQTLIHTANLQTIYFGDRHLQEELLFSRPRRLEPRHLDIAKENLSRCAFVGITEEFSASIHLAERVLGVRLGQPIHANVTHPGQENPAGESLRDLIRPHLALDEELYAFARTLFREQLAKIT